MLDSYSVPSQRVVSFATMEARQLEHPHVGTEHLLLGLLSDDDSDTAAVLRSAGASLAAARHKVSELISADAGVAAGDDLPLTARAQRALDRAARFSRQDREPEVRAEHVLLGVLDVEGLGCQVLRGLSVDIVQLRKTVVGAPADDGPATLEVPDSNASTLELVNPDDIAAPSGYTHVIAATGSRMVFIAGQVAEDVAGNLIGAGDLAAQARQAFANVGRCLASIGARPDQVTKLTIYVVKYKPEYWAAICEARDAVFGDHKPTDTLLGVESLAERRYMIEVDAIAVVD